MKKYLLALFALMSAVALAQKRTVVSGKILSSTVAGVKVSHLRNFLEGDYIDFNGTLNKNKTFKLTLDLSEPKTVSFNHGDKSITLFLEPGDSVYITADAKVFYEKLKFYGKGANNNTFRGLNYHSIYALRDEGLFYKTLTAKVKTQRIEACKSYCDSILRVKLEYLWSQKAMITPAFYDATYYQLYCDILSAKMYLPIMKEHIEDPTFTKALNFTHYLSYYSFLDSITIANDSLVNNYHYTRFLVNYISIKYEIVKRSLQKLPDKRDNEYRPDEHYRDLYNLSDILLTGKCRDFMLAYGTVYTMTKGSRSAREFAFHNLISQVKNESLISIIKRLKDKNENRADSPQKGEEFPEYVLVDIDNKPVSITELKGKVVYIDFWATWCGPCMADLPFSKKLKEKYKDNDIVFVNISVDDDEKKWREVVVKESIGGININIPSKEQATKYGIRIFPTYFLLDKTGKVVSKSRPREETIEKQIEDLL